jgi:predicted MFS family arabinose efflux permease
VRPPGPDCVAAAPTRPPALPRTLVLVLALACGVAVANVYFPQAITPLIAAGMNISPGSATLVAAATQLGYAAGIFLFVPLGDRLRPRPLVTTLLAVTGLGLIIASTAHSLTTLVSASVLVGAATVVPQILIPMAAGLVGTEQRGRVTGTLLSGLLGGILLARAFGGILGQWLGWRAPYIAAAVLAAISAAALARALPVTQPPSQQRYLTLLGDAVRLLRTEPELRRSCQYQATMFAGFTAVWTSVTLLVTGPTYHLGTTAVGLVALVGAGSVFSSPIAGRRADTLGAGRVNLACFTAAITAAAILALAGLGGTLGLVALVCGILLLDVAVQCGQVANQTRIFALPGDRRSRLNTAYMTCAFLGGSLGSWLGVRTYLWLAWPGVCGLLALLALTGLTAHLLRPPAETIGQPPAPRTLASHQ